MKFLRVAQKLDQFLHFILRFLNAGDIAERDFVLISRQHAGLRFAEVKGAFSSHADLLPEQEIEDEQEKRDGQEADHGLRDNVGLGPNGRLNTRGSEPFLEIRAKA